MEKTLKMMFIVMSGICIGTVLLYLYSAPKREKAEQMEQTGEPREELEQASEAEQETEQKPEQTPEPEEDLDSASEIMPKIIDTIADEEKVTALCEDGSVWSWDRESGEKSAVRVEGFRDVKKIMHAGSAVYALSEDGRVYVWGNNKCLRSHRAGEETEYYEEAQAVPGLADIVDMDANVDLYADRTRAFAVDSKGNLYVRGLFLHEIEDEDYIPTLLNENREAGEGVVSVFAGAGCCHYFIREDGTVFSVMDERSAPFRDYKESGTSSFIYPVLPIVELGTEPGKSLTWFDIPYVDLRECGMSALTNQYELGIDERITHIDADRCTVFMALDDNSLWYWDSKMIPFHDWKDAQVDLENCQQDFCGSWKTVVAGDIAGMESHGELPVIDICADADNVLFLTEDGNVFMSEYVTSEVKDVEYYNNTSTNPYREQKLVAYDLNLKELSFRKLDWENIVSINTDGTYHFTAVDADGGCYYLDMGSEE